MSFHVPSLLWLLQLAPLDVEEWQERQNRLRSSMLEQAKKDVDLAVKVMEREQTLALAEGSSSKNRRAVVLYLDKGDSGIGCSLTKFLFWQKKLWFWKDIMTSTIIHRPPAAAVVAECLEDVRSGGARGGV